MAQASGILTQLTYVKETTRGTTPGSPSCTVLRLNSYDINGQKTELRSSEMRADRMVASMRHGQKSVAGTLEGELALQVHDDWLEVAMGGSWDGTIAAADNIGATSTGDKFTRSTGSFITDGFRPGDIITTASFSNGGNNGNFLVTAVAALEVDVVDLDGTAASLTTEAVGAGPTMDLAGERCDVGTELESFTVERQFTDISQYQVFRGVTPNETTFDFQPEDIPKVTFNVLGMDFDDMSGSSIDGTPTAAPENEAMSPVQGAIFVGGTAMTGVTGARISVNNSRSLIAVVGATSSPDLFEGESLISGEVTILLEDATYVSLFEDETESTLWLRMVDPADTTQFISFALYRVKFNAAGINPPRSGPCVITMPFEALRHETYDMTMALQKSNS